tara:strand:+ start:431 stop:622 length:192 start_codon:yes stop_codon:yes gene_type:complete
MLCDPKTPALLLFEIDFRTWSEIADPNFPRGRFYEGGEVDADFPHRPAEKLYPYGLRHALVNI